MLARIIFFAFAVCFYFCTASYVGSSNHHFYKKSGLPAPCRFCPGPLRGGRPDRGQKMPAQLHALQVKKNV